MEATVTLTEEEKVLPPHELLKKFDEELRNYGSWLEKRDRKGPLSAFERDLLRSYLWWKTKT